MKKILSNVFFGACALGVAWIGLSVLEVMCNNLNPDYEYCALNMFSILMGA